MIKKVYAIAMTYEVSSEEKRYAEQALTNFDEAVQILDTAADFLNNIKTPFKDNPPAEEDEILSRRAALRRYRDKAAENFNAFKIKAFSCVSAMNKFSSDTMTAKLMQSFISSIDVLETDVNDFLELFEDLKAKEFQAKVVSSCEKIQKQCDDVKEIADQRIRDHIQKNILAKNWVDNISSELQTNVEKHVPIMTEINQQEKEQLNKMINNKGQ